MRKNIAEKNLFVVFLIERKTKKTKTKKKETSLKENKNGEKSRRNSSKNEGNDETTFE